MNEVIKQDRTVETDPVITGASWDSVLTPRVLLAAALLLSVLVALSALTLYDHYVLRPRQQVATVALRDLLELKQLQVTIALTRPGVTDREREAGYDEIAGFAKRLETALDELSMQCACTILVRDAVVKTHGADLTSELARRLGVADLKRDELIDRLRRQGGSTPVLPSPDGAQFK